ncbi:uncharacterized protein LOC123258162 [Drosophila ananassae]|uniref:uncharacterized protein LOC123258162 n=1 Tax=Drosophila ananassae TaxID=7217 RepID=UPI001CFFBD88|nr:uncharacterized protein LOC123258162 [Drosophila ananassae]
MIDDELRRDLGVQGEQRQLNIQWFGGSGSRDPTNLVSLEISGAGKPTRHPLRNVYAVSSLSLPMQTLCRRDVQGVLKDSRLPMKPYCNGVPKLLIGLDHGHLGLPLRTRRFAREGPYAAATELGWVEFGPVSGQSTTPSPRSCLLAVSMDDTMEKMVEDYFEMESFGVKLAPPVAASDDARAQMILEDTTVKPRLEEPRQIRRYKPLPAVLFHFREGAVEVCGDIKEMFHQVLIRPEDRCSQRFLWRDGNDDRDLDVYEMNIRVKAIIDHHYVDDYVDSFALESEVIAVSTRVKEIHAELCQFLSSSPIVKVALGPPGQVKSVGWGEAEQKILGMRWQVATDDFRFNVEYHRVPKSVLSGDRVPTKREYLSLLMSTFDPLGFLCCLKITAKLLLREIWKQKIQWDEPLPEEKAEPLLPDAERWTPWDSSDVLATILGLEQFEPLSCMCSWMQPASGWPSPEKGTEHVPVAPDEEEMPSEFALVASNEFVSPFQRFSSFCRLVRTTAWVLRFARRCRKQRSELEEYGLTATECEAAENLLVRQALLESFPDEMRSAKRGKDVATSSEIRGLTPYVDENGLLRVYGRVDAELFMPYSARRPVILSHRHSLTEMVVRHFHDQMKHQNVDATIAQIRTRFWVKKMRRLLKEVISSCNECKLQRTRPMPPIMGPLPVDRLKAGGWPFKYTGLDYFGRLLVTVARHRKKRWVALFTCLTTRAIQLRKLAHDLSTDSCIIAIRNFVCRRGPIRKRDWRPDDLEMFSRRRGYRGGVWERMVQCVKRVLRHTLKEVAPRDLVLESLLMEA